MPVEQAISTGPHENPYSTDYRWWASKGRTFFNGHEFTVTCACGARMQFDALYGNGQQFNFICDSCTVERERVIGDGSFESNLSVSLCPNDATPANWQTFVDGEQATIAREGESWTIQRDDRDETFTVDSETLPEAVTDA
ncbi:MULTISPECIES: hypothetical protein [Halorussus]|uniref:hypothetical protein n=1 Tax=Halorussus TaxID=1070314 RepID=UPI00209F2797|nr:hypothetical protein [Halorussus vallis]USZ78725.1 hypothetical protein NGM07_24755 [Halorussus vallis]